MFAWLIRLFIKHSDQVTTPVVRTRYGVLASVFGLLLNTLLFIIKFIVGSVLQSLSITADAWNNLSDASTSLISLIGIQAAKKPADQDHPFGHGRIEYLAGLVVSLFILLVGGLLIKEGVTKILHPEPTTFQWLLILLLSFTLLVKYFLHRFYRYIGKTIHSSLFKATSLDARNDILITAATMLSLFIEYYTGWMVDGWIGFGVALFIVFSGFESAKQTMKPLLGSPINKTLYQAIQEKVASYPGILGSHDLVIHNYGPTHQMATIHVEVNQATTLEAVHQLVHEIELAILETFDVAMVIHVDPVVQDNHRWLAFQAFIETTLHAMEKEASVHDFQLLTKTPVPMITFDIVVPYSYDEEAKGNLTTRLLEQIKIHYPTFLVTIHLETSFVDKEEE